MVLTAPIGRAGAFVEVELSLTGYEIHRRQSGAVRASIPLPIRGRGLLDTGSEVSIISNVAAEALSLDAMRTVPVTTSTGTGGGPVYSAQITLGWNQRPRARALETNVVGQPLRGIHMLIGRDILRHGQLTWDGPAAVATLRFPAAAN